MNDPITRLHVGRVDLAGRFNPPTFEDSRIDVFAYLVLIDDRVVLVDTGVGTGNAYIEKTFRPSHRNIVTELQKAGVRPEDVTVVVNSHLHFDHCGANTTFPNATFYIQSAELETARTTPYTVREWFDYEGATLCPVDGDHQLTDHIGLLSTPGHTPGHQSLLVETPAATVVIAAQAAYTIDEYERGGDPKTQAHEGYEKAYVASIARLKAVRPDRVLFSHDAAELGCT